MALAVLESEDAMKGFCTDYIGGGVYDIYYFDGNNVTVEKTLDRDQVIGFCKAMRINEYKQIESLLWFAKNVKTSKDTFDSAKESYNKALEAFKNQKKILGFDENELNIVEF